MTVDIETAKLIVAILGFGGTITALYFGYRQYKRSEQWKRAEFVAKEIKEFESDPVVRNVFQMVDWGDRRINLYQRDDIEFDEYVRVTRDDQWRALLPHGIKREYPSLKVDSNIPGQKKYTAEEIQIRDSYDIFLDYLQRFGHFVEAGLVSKDELKPYLTYWLESLAFGDGNEDIEWRFATLGYINYYKFSGVIELFKAFDIDISPDGEVFKEIGEKIEDKDFYEKLLYLVRGDVFRKDIAGNREAVPQLEAQAKTLSKQS